MKYRPEIDGLRAIAVLPVVLFHAGFKTFSGGFVGVDIFFVISGYLITTIIVAELDQDRFSLAEFYERRARRILPALFFVTACCIPFAWIWMLPAAFESFTDSIIAVVFFVSNMLFLSETGYFSPDAETKPLLHTWSLAVEEQFYIFFPLLLMLIWRRDRNKVLGFVAAIAIVSLLSSEWAWRNKPAANFYILPTRAWELLAGSICALLLRRGLPDIGSWTREALAALGLAMIAASIFLFGETTPVPSVYALAPVLGTCLLVLCADAKTIVAKLLSLKWIVGVGLISYSTYLWHQPLFAFARIRSMGEPPDALMFGLCLASLVLAYATWRFIEVPARTRGAWPLPTRAKAFQVFGAVAAVFVLFGLVSDVRNGFPERLTAEAARVMSVAQDHMARKECFGGDGDEACVYGDPANVRFALVGDSHAHAIAHELGRAMSAAGAGFKEYTQNGCPPVGDYARRDKDKLNDCAVYHNKVMRHLGARPDLKTVILLARWQLYIEFDRFDNSEGGIEPGGRVPPLSKGAFDESAMKAKVGALYRDTIEDLLAMGKNVVIVYGVPEAGWNVPDRLAQSVMFGEDVGRPLSIRHDLVRKRAQFADAQLDAIESDRIARVKPEAIFCSTPKPGRCVAEEDGEPLYADDDHLSNKGAARVAHEIVGAAMARGW